MTRLPLAILIFLGLSGTTLAQGVGISDNPGFSPNKLFQIHLNANYGDLLQLTNNLTGSQADSGVIFGYQNDNGRAEFQFRNHHPGGDIDFYTTPAGVGSTPIERFFIDANGMVGIGTGIPDAHFHILGSIDRPQFKIVPMPTQTADIMQVYNPNITSKYFTINATGKIMVGGTGQTTGANLFQIAPPGIEPTLSISSSILEIDADGSDENDPYAINLRLSDDNVSKYPSMFLSRSLGDLTTPVNVDEHTPLGGYYFRAYTNESWTDLSGMYSEFTGTGSDVNSDLEFKTTLLGSTVPRLFISSEGHVGVGTGANTFDLHNPEGLKVDNGDQTTVNVISGYGNLDNYLQLNIKNRSDGTSASSDVVASNNQSTESTFYIDMGINSSGYDNEDYTIQGPNDSYIQCTGNETTPSNLIIGTSSPNSVIKFNTAGTLAENERMRIDASGNVGIGTSSPQMKLEIGGITTNSEGFRLQDGTSSVGHFIVDADPNSIISGTKGSIAQDYENGAVYVNTNGSTGWSQLATSVGSPFVQNGNSFGTLSSLGTNDNYDLAFRTDNAERMRLDVAGNFGIGTPSPSVRLHLGGLSANSESFRVQDGTSHVSQYIVNSNPNGSITATRGSLAQDYVNGAIYVNTNGTTGWSQLSTAGASSAFIQNGNSFGSIANLGTSDNNPLAFLTNSGERMRVSATGNVGIGSNSPSVKLHIGGLTANTEGIRLQDGSSYVGQFIVNGNPNTSVTANKGSIAMDYVNGAIYVNTSGTNLWSQLSTSGAANEFVQNGNTFGSLASLGTNDNFGLAFRTNNTEKMRLDPAGFLGLGINSPSAKLHLGGLSVNTEAIRIQDGTSYVSHYIVNTNPNGSVTGTKGSLAQDYVNGAIYVNTNGSTGWSQLSTAAASSAFVQNGNSFGSIASLGTNDNYGLVFRTNNAERIRLDPAGNFGIGTNSPSIKLHVGGLSSNTEGLRLQDGTSTVGHFIVNTDPNGSVSGTKGSVAQDYVNGALYVNTNGSTGWSQVVTDASNAILQNGNSFGTTANIGTNDANALTLETNNSERLRIQSTGNVGINTTTPNSNMQVNGSFALPIRTVSVATNIAATDYTVLVNSTGSVTIYLPTAVGISGRMYIVKRIGSGTVTVGSNGGLIDGAPTLSISTSYRGYIFQSNGTNWYIIGRTG
jgi:hypothetical protein